MRMGHIKHHYCHAEHSAQAVILTCNRTTVCSILMLMNGEHAHSNEHWRGKLVEGWNEKAEKVIKASSACWLHPATQK